MLQEYSEDTNWQRTILPPRRSRGQYSTDLTVPTCPRKPISRATNLLSSGLPSKPPLLPTPPPLPNHFPSVRRRRSLPYPTPQPPIHRPGGTLRDVTDGAAAWRPIRRQSVAGDRINEAARPGARWWGRGVEEEEEEEGGGSCRWRRPPAGRLFVVVNDVFSYGKCLSRILPSERLVRMEVS